MATMNRDGLMALYVYNAYANHLVLDGMEQLAEDEFTREPCPSHGSIRRLLLHTLECEAWFLALCQGRQIGDLDLPTLADICHCWSNLECEQQAFIGGLTENDLAREVTVELRQNPRHLLVWQLLVQAFVHSTHHRAELGILLGQMGHGLPTLDIIIHFIRQSGQTWE